MEKSKINFCGKNDSKKLILSLDETVHELSSALAKCQTELAAATATTAQVREELWIQTQHVLHLLGRNDRLKLKVTALKISNQRKAARLIRVRKRIKVAWKKFIKVIRIFLFTSELTKNSSGQ